MLTPKVTNCGPARVLRRLALGFTVLVPFALAFAMPLPASASGWGRQTLDPSAGYSNATTTYGGNPHVFDYDLNGALRHCWWTGSSWPCQLLDGHWGGRGQIATVVAGGQLHVFYSYLYSYNSFLGTQDYRLAHMWYDTTWHWELLGPAPLTHLREHSQNPVFRSDQAESGLSGVQNALGDALGGASYISRWRHNGRSLRWKSTRLLC